MVALVLGDSTKGIARKQDAYIVGSLFFRWSCGALPRRGDVVVLF